LSKNNLNDYFKKSEDEIKRKIIKLKKNKRKNKELKLFI
jgi:hypothetical protein